MSGSGRGGGRWSSSTRDDEDSAKRAASTVIDAYTIGDSAPDLRDPVLEIQRTV